MIKYLKYASWGFYGFKEITIIKSVNWRLEQIQQGHIKLFKKAGDAISVLNRRQSQFFTLFNGEAIRDKNRQV